MDDLISRQAAIERATKDHDFYKGATTPADKARRDELLNVMCWLGDLPSAQPEIIRCRDCRYWGAYPSSSAMPWLHECYARIARLHTAADEFCSRAERREVSE